MSILRSAAVSVLLLASGLTPACAQAPLPAGTPAGTQNAALLGSGFAIALGLGAIIAATVVIVANDNDKGVTTTTTTTTTGTSP